METSTPKSDNMLEIEALLTLRRALSAAERQKLRRLLAGLVDLNLAKGPWSNAMSKIGVEGACALAGALGGMTVGLATLDLEFNGIGDEGVRALAGVLCCMPELVKLHLGLNSIKAKGMCALAVALGRMPGLAKLHLGYNKIQAKGARALARVLVGMTGLATLHLGSNEIGAKGARALAGVLGGMTGLAALNLSHNHIGADGAHALAGVLGGMPALATLNLGANSIGDEGACALGGVLGSMTGLATVDLFQNDIGAQGIRALAGALGGLIGLATLHLGRNEIGAEGVRALGGALGSMTGLATLHLGSNEIGAEGARALARALGSMTRLAELDLSFNGIGDEGTHALTGALGGMLALATLDLSGNKIEAEGARALATVLGRMLGLTKLSLNENFIKAEGARALAGALGRMPGLATLNLIHTEIGYEGVRALVRALGGMPGLAVLNLDFNGIGDDGARAIAGVLGGMTRLDTLYLDSNHIGDVGACALAGALGGMTGLVTLSLGNNDIGDEGARTLGRMTGVAHLVLIFNKIKAQGACALAGVLGGMTGLAALDLRCNDIGAEGTRALARALGGMPKLELLLDDKETFETERENAVRLHQARQKEAERARVEKDIANLRVREARARELAAEADRARALKEAADLRESSARESASLNQALEAERARNRELESRVQRTAINGHSRDASLRTYRYSELAAATTSFAEANKLGEGGFGKVYKGLIGHTDVAVKVLAADSQQGPAEFQNEVDVHCLIRHPNIVMLLGMCVETARCLVYELMPNGNLEDRLMKPGADAALTWQSRMRIASEIATALLYLHSSSPDPIIHRDIKPANILLDGNLVAKLGDVGIAKIASDLAVHHATHITTSNLAGTFAYMDPEYSQSGQFGLASDVYSYGVVLLQLLTGLPPLGLPHRVSAALNAGRLKTVLDAKAGDWPMEDAASLSRLALSCTAMTRNGRPSLGEEIVPKLNELKKRASSSGIARGEVPYKYLCPISQDIMEDPVLACDGHHYDRASIAAWLLNHSTSPMTNLEFATRELYGDVALRNKIREWRERHKC